MKHGDAARIGRGKWFEVEEWYDMAPQPMPKLSRDQALFVLMCMDQPNVFYSKMDDFCPSVAETRMDG